MEWVKRKTNTSYIFCLHHCINDLFRHFLINMKLFYFTLSYVIHYWIIHKLFLYILQACIYIYIWRKTNHWKRHLSFMTYCTKLNKRLIVINDVWSTFCSVIGVKCSIFGRLLSSSSLEGIIAKVTLESMVRLFMFATTFVEPLFYLRPLRFFRGPITYINKTDLSNPPEKKNYWRST